MIMRHVLVVVFLEKERKNDDEELYHRFYLNKFTSNDDEKSNPIKKALETKGSRYFMLFFLYDVPSSN